MAGGEQGVDLSAAGLVGRDSTRTATTRNGAILTVLIGGDAEVGDMAYEVALFVGQAERHLPVRLEAASTVRGGDTAADSGPAPTWPGPSVAHP
ncbi:hypothetical protein ACGF5C_34215 [Micromonospora sp. NPDC047620]|uniref:hypothetical protein n=1 Tax=Micromonospora sp. NPDC047620 TaxID=3364251 RepID=UPI00371F220F